MAISKDLLDELVCSGAPEAEAGGGAEKAEARRAKGLMTARDRLAALFQADTFQEFGLHARHETDHFTIESKAMGGDGVVTGIGYVDGRPVAAFSQDFTVAGGSLGRTHAEKICTVMDYAERTGIRSSASTIRAAPVSRRASSRCPATARCSTVTCACPGWCRRSPSSP